jgi:PAS domain-containing protein
MAREEEFAASALIEGLTAGAPVGFALVAADGEAVLSSAPLAGVAGIAELAADVLASGHAVTGRALEGPAGRRFVATARPLVDGGRRLAAVLAVDVTERARTDAALRESERALADAQRMARMGWWVVWPESGVAVQSPELLQLTGMDAGRERELSEAIREHGRRAIAAGEPLDFRHDVPQSDGTVRTLRVCGDLVARGGEGVALHGFAQDISELARATTQQRVVAELDRVALGDAPVQELIEQVTGAAARTLDVRRVAVLELDPAGRELLLRGLAPPSDTFPRVLPAGEASFAGYTLRLRRPVVVEDWMAETASRPRSAARSACAAAPASSSAAPSRRSAS